MRVLFLQRQPCIRALKYAVGLRAAGGDLRLGFALQGQTLSEWYGAGDELFDSWHRLGDDPAAGLRRALAEFEPDVIHSHNLPDRLTVLAQELADGGTPVIHDVHDLQSLRQTPYEDGFPEPDGDLEALERRAVEGSAALLTVSRELLAEIDARHRAPARRGVFANYALARDLPTRLPPPERARRGPPRLVYQGTLSTNGGHYDLREIFAAIVAEGVALDIYPARPAPAYRALAERSPRMRCHETLSPSALPGVLPAYDFGWAGFNAALNGAHLDTALPNKVFEYLGCGLPVLTFEHRAVAHFVTEQGVGLSLATLEGLGERLAALDLPALRRRAAAARFELTVEANIGAVTDLYASVAG
jgi:glycosyltransferase involved in cell wall biosynthesis